MRSNYCFANAKQEDRSDRVGWVLQFLLKFMTPEREQHLFLMFLMLNLVRYIRNLRLFLNRRKNRRKKSGGKGEKEIPGTVSNMFLSDTRTDDYYYYLQEVVQLASTFYQFL